MERKKRLVCLDDGEDGCWKWIFMEFCNCGFLKYFFFSHIFLYFKGGSKFFNEIYCRRNFSIFFFNQVEEFGVKFMPMSFRDFVINIYLSDLFDFK